MEQPQKTLVNKVNKYLLETHGRIPDGRPRYKISWSEDCLEWRKAKVNKFDEHGNFLAEIEGTECRKKWNWINNRYLFLKWFPGSADQGEIQAWDGYECLFCFDNNGEFLLPTIYACEFMIQTLKNATPTNAAAEKAADEQRQIQEMVQNRAELAEAGKLREGESVGYTREEFGNG